MYFAHVRFGWYAVEGPHHTTRPASRVKKITEAIAMPTDEYFSSTYQQARSKFVDAAHGAKARLSSYVLPGQKGPDGSELIVDVAEIRPSEQPNLVIIISGTHGVEGFCGSGCQVGFLVERIYEGLPKTVGVALMHALNPYGFAWLRRVNEDNVDLNRNFHDFTEPPPSSSAYDAVHDWLVPADWDGPARTKADSEIEQYLKSHGLAAFQAIVSRGQYSRPAGMFFGGSREAWSNMTFKKIMAQLLTKSVSHVAVIDLHTGLGPAGYGEPIYPGTDLVEYFRVLRWFGLGVTSTVKGDSTSASVSASLANGVRTCAGSICSTYIAVEYGTVPVMEVFKALRADNWFHAYSDQSDPRWGAIKKGIRDAFYVDEPWWKAAVYGRSVDMILRAGRGLGSP
jgi:hypothetical protein